MSKIVVDLREDGEVSESGAGAAAETERAAVPAVPQFGNYQSGEEKSVRAKVFKIFSVALAALIFLSLIGGFFYWRYLKTTPQYSLALIVDAARRDDQEAIDKLVDLNAIVEDFLPQVVAKAVELYGRGLAPDVIKKARIVAAPLLPVVKQRARSELPDLIREKTKRFESIPFWAIAMGAGRYLEIEQTGDKALIKSKLKARPLEIEMQRGANGLWKIIAVRDEQTAQKIARKIGQEVLTIAKSRDEAAIENVGRQIGLDNAGDLLKEVEDIFK